MPFDLDDITGKSHETGLDIIKKVDREGMLEAVENFPHQAKEAIEIANRTPLVIKVTRPKAIVVLGMGGSGISGDVTKILLEEELKVPVVVNKGYLLPSFVDEKTLCFAVSYSGNTEETLASFEQAEKRGAKIVLVSSGGELAEKAAQLNLPLVKIPVGLQPRAALGYLSLPIIVVLHRLGLIESKEKDFEEMLTLLGRKAKEWGSKRPLEKNQAQLLAMRIHSKLPIVYGSDGITALAALRWKCQFNENSKVCSFFHVFPELNHNETVGWQLLEELTHKFCLILLRDAGEHQQIKKRIKITRDLIAKQFGDVLEVYSEGKSPLTRLFSLIYLGDFLSVYLAILNGVDPTPVEKVNILKKKLAETN